MLCLCMGHTRDEIKGMIIEGDFSSLAEFQEETFIGTGCGHCLSEVENLFDSFAG